MFTQKFNFTAAIFALVFLMPSVSHAYIDPFQAITFFEPPPTSRSSQQRVAQQQAESALRRAAEQEIIFAAQHDLPNQEFVYLEGQNFLDTGVPVFESADSHVEQNESLDLILDALDDIQLAQQELEAEVFQSRRPRHAAGGPPPGDFFAPEPSWIGSARGGHDRHQHEHAHGHNHGRHLAHTGAGSVLAIILLVVAGVWTVRRARQAEEYIVMA